MGLVDWLARQLELDATRDERAARARRVGAEAGPYRRVRCGRDGVDAGVHRRDP